MYVPEIGDHIILTQDWFFDLHPEYRNLDLGNFFGHYICYQDGWIDEKVLPQMRPPDYNIQYPANVPYAEQVRKFKEAEDNCSEYQAYQRDMLEWRQKLGQLEPNPVLKVCLPKDTVLAIDRIYIRKGASDFSSITFYAKNLGVPAKGKRKAFRFWAKLEDCNRIYFEKTDKIK